ncbi:MAG: glycosyltransferase [Desulfovibrio sp.]
MTVASIPLSWVDIPEPVRRLLLHGSVGRDHLVSVARLLPGIAAGAAPGQRAQLLQLAQDVLLAAYDEAPLDGSLASLLLSSSASGWPGLPLPVADALKAVANFWAPPGQEHPWWRATSLQERQSLARQGLGAEPRNLFWKLSAWNVAWPQADIEQIDALLSEKFWPRTLLPVRHRFAAQAHLLRGDPHSALASLNACSLASFWNDSGLRAECLLRMGRADDARDALRQSLLRSPWRVSQWLRLHDIECGQHLACAPAPGPVAILLYTWNKARELDETLASLAASDLGEARMWVLDNGSTDQTPQILAAWRERLGARLTVLRLPVNIGAPAARNWLLSLPEVRRNPYLVFLDDDVTLPADWLPRLGAGLAAVPQASVWGCRVVDEANPSVLQSVDLTPVPVEPGAPPLALPGLHLGQPDFGQFSYLRPCVSVTGCCHLLREADIDTTGGFDIRFSPSQYDDLERDLRLGLSGGFAAYQGHLALRHKRRSGAAAERSAAELGNATANTHKLLTKHSVEDLRRVRELGEALLERDLADKMERLAGA